MTSDRLPPATVGEVPEQPSSDRRRALLGVLVVACVVVAAGFAIYRQRHAFGAALSKIGVWPVLASAAFALIGVGSTFSTWREILRGLDVDLPWGAGARIFFTSQLGKYLPGSVWPIVMQMEAGRARGASRRAMIAANLVTILLSCTVGLAMAAVLLPFTAPHALSQYWWLLVALPVLLGLTHPRSVPWLLDRLFLLLRREPLGERVRVGASLRASGWSVLSFVCFGAHVALLGAALGHWNVSMFVLGIGGMALAVSAGVLFIPAPAGAGIRDVVLTLVLGAILSSGQALAVVVMSRALLIAIDLLLAAVAALLRPGRRRLRLAE